MSRCLRTLGVAREDRDDWTQIVMMQAYGSFGDYNPWRGRPYRWLNRIVVHTACHYHVQACRRRRVLSPDEETGEEMADDRPSPEEALRTQEALWNLLGAIRDLPPELRQILRAHELDEVPISEFARTAGISPLALYKRRVHALSALRAAMARLELRNRRG